MLKVLKIDTTTHHELPWLPLELRRSPSVYTRLALYPRKLCPRPITRCQVLRDSQPQNNAVAIKPRRSELGVSAGRAVLGLDRKSTRLNSSHVSISYAVFCLKKKKLY